MLNFRKQAELLTSRQIAALLLRDWVAETQVKELPSKAKVIGCDWDGAFFPSEPSMIIAITNVHNAYNGDREDWDLMTMTERMAGTKLDAIFDILGHDHGLGLTVSKSLEVHTDEYLNVLSTYGLGPNQAIHNALKYVKKAFTPYCFVLTNGNKSAINHLMEKHNIRVFDKVVGTERTISDKIDYVRDLSERMHFDPSAEFVWIDDSVPTIIKMQSKLGVRCVFVRHELNDNGFVPDTGIVVDGYAPALYRDYPCLREKCRRPAPTGGSWSAQLTTHKI